MAQNQIDSDKKDKDVKLPVEAGGDNVGAGGKKASFFIGEEKSDPPFKKYELLDANIGIRIRRNTIVGPNDEEINPEEIVVGPDGGFGWVVVLASFMSNIVVDGIIFSFGLMAGPMREAFLEDGQDDVTVSSIAWVSSLQNGFYLLGGPFVSALSNKFGFRVVAILGSVLGSGGFLLAWLFSLTRPNFYGLLVFYGLIGGSGFCLLYVPSVIAVGFYFEKKRALATGIAICGSGVGTFIMAPLTYTLVNQFGWKITLVIQSGMILMCSLCGAMYRPVKPTIRLTTKENKTKKDDDTLNNKKEITPFPSPEGTPLLMRIKKAREMEKWDSVGSISDEKPTAASKARKASTQSLNPIQAHKQTKRMSVPTIPALPSGGDAQTQSIQRINTSNSMKKTTVGGDLKEIKEIDEAEENTGSEENTKKLDVGEGESNTRLVSSSLTVRTQRIGNSLLMIDEITKSRILRVDSKQTINKPIYRDDIFYSGSMKRIPEYIENVETGGLSSYEWTAIISSKPPPASSSKNPSKKASILAKLTVLRKMLDFGLLLSPSFILLAISGFFTMLGFFVPFIYLKGLAMENSVTEGQAPMLISIIGVSNTIGRIICGFLADRPKINAIIINNVALTFGGIITIFAPFFVTFWPFAGYSVVFGLSIACFASLRSILVVELLGLGKLTNAFGLLCLFQGISAIAGTPLAGWLYDTTATYDFTFYVAGSFILFSGILCYPIQRINKWEKSKNNKKNVTA